MSNWYNKKKEASMFGLDPFGPSELTDKTRVSPFGHAGGDEHFGVLEPSTGKNAPNRYIEDDEKNKLTEKELEELKNKLKKRKKKIKKTTIVSFSNRLKKESQWGLEGPKMPTWGESDWFAQTYRDIMGGGKEEKEAPHEPQEDFTTSVLESTITINATAEGQREIGSGFFIGPNIILTCAHVVIPGMKSFNAQISIRINKDQEYQGQIIAYDANLDVAVISISDPNFSFERPLRLGNSGQAVPGEEIITVGTPLGFENVMGKGIVSSSSVDYQEGAAAKQYLFVSTNINPGNSGGPVVKTSNGAVIGIAAAVISTQEGGDSGLNAAIPIDTVKPFLKQNNINFEFVEG